MTLSGKRICVALPDTILEEHDSLREKTGKLGQIARSCSIFGVDEVLVFQDKGGRGESALIRRVLEYLETPQYLRKRLFPISEDLRYAGLLPPLRIPSHKPRLPLDKLPRGERRDGVVLPDGATADVGLDVPLKLLGRRDTPGRRITVKIARTSPLEGVPIDPRESGVYWGYRVQVCSLAQLLSDGEFGLKVATSRLGDSAGAIVGELSARFHRADSAMLIFGAPSRGLFEIIGSDLRSKVDYVVNLFPEQSVVTVRSEEALMCALYLIMTLSWLSR